MIKIQFQFFHDMLYYFILFVKEKPGKKKMKFNGSEMDK
jgi:hypothetical protein